MLERLRRFRRLNAEERGIFLRAVFLLPVISLSLKIRGFRATQEFLLRFLPNAQPVSQNASLLLRRDIERIEITERMVNSAVCHVWRGSNCLQRSLALWWLLRLQGLSSELRIGARKINGKFEAHAWVERQGVALNDPDQQHRHYATFDAAFPLQNSEIL